MGLSKSGVLIRAVLGLAVGSGACYWLYTRLFSNKPPAASPSECKDVPINPSSNLEAQHVQKLIELLDATEEPSIREKALITLSNSAAFSVNQDLIRNLGGISVIGRMLSDPDSQVKVQALNTLNNLSMNIENQKVIKDHIENFCTIVDASPLNSSLQLAALGVLTNMAVTNDYHDLLVPSIPCFVRVLVEGNEGTQVCVLKVLVNMSANASMTRYLLSVQEPALVSFFNQCTNGDCLVPALTFVANLNENMRYKDSATCGHPYAEDSLFSTLFRDLKNNLKKLSDFLQHPDEDVKRQMARMLATQPT